MTPNQDTQLRNALLSLSADIATHHPPQPAITLWLRAHYRARHAAIERAALPLRIMHAFAILAAILAAAFTLHQYRVTTPGFLTAFCISLAVVALVAGCAAVFLAGRRPATSSPAVPPR